MDNIGPQRVERYWDAAHNVIYDWDSEFQCYVGYNPDRVNTADPFYYMYQEDEEDTVGEDVLPKSHSPDPKKKSASLSVLTLLEPTVVKKVLPKASPPAAPKAEPETDPYNLAKAGPARAAKLSEQSPTPAVKAQPPTQSIDSIRQELRAEVQQAVREGSQGRRSLTRRLTRKLTTIGGNAMSVQDQLNLIADVKKEAGELDIDEDAINEATAKENAAAHAREIARKLLKKSN